MTKIKIDYHGIFMQISNEMRILDWHTLKCPQLVHFQVPHDMEKVHLIKITGNSYRLKNLINDENKN